MQVFSIVRNKLTLVKEAPVSLERDLQAIVEANLELVFGLKFVATEFTIGNCRIDTLAYDPAVKSFVIIEYKRQQNATVADQGFEYLSLMLRKREAFILQYKEKVDNNLKSDDIDWSQSRVMFVAGSFTTRQRNALNFRDLPIELWVTTLYENNTILFDQIHATDDSGAIDSIARSEDMKQVSRELKKYSVDDHFKQGWEKSREIYGELADKVLQADPRIEVNPTKIYIGFRIGSLNVAIAWICKSGIDLQFSRTKPEQLKDPQKSVKYVKNSFKWYNQHVSSFWIANPEEIDYAIFLVKQVLSPLPRPEGRGFGLGRGILATG